jgi:hypothetical protein
VSEFQMQAASVRDATAEVGNFSGGFDLHLAYTAAFGIKYVQAPWRFWGCDRVPAHMLTMEFVERFHGSGLQRRAAL